MTDARAGLRTSIGSQLQRDLSANMSTSQASPVELPSHVSDSRDPFGLESKGQPALAAAFHQTVPGGFPVIGELQC